MCVPDDDDDRPNLFVRFFFVLDWSQWNIPQSSLSGRQSAFQHGLYIFKKQNTEMILTFSSSTIINIFQKKKKTGFVWFCHMWVWSRFERLASGIFRREITTQDSVFFFFPNFKQLHKVESNLRIIKHNTIEMSIYIYRSCHRSIYF